MKTYLELKLEHQKRVDNFEGLFFAYSNEQFKEGLKKVGLDPESPTDKIVTLGDGAYILQSRAKDFMALLDLNEKEKKEYRKDKKQLLDMLIYELNNHEYCITRDPQDALDALGLKLEDIPEDIWLKAHNACKDEPQ